MKIARNIFAGLSVAIILLFAGLFMASSIINAENNTPVVTGAEPTADISQVYKDALLSTFAKAGSEIKDPNIAQFYQKLIQSYELDKIPESSSSSESDKMVSLLPDIKKINKSAIDLTLKEAGKQIKDKEIAEFYNSFLKQISVDK